MPRIAGDLLLGSAFIIVGAGAIGIISQVEKTALASRGILESQTLPIIYASLLIGLSALMIASTLMRRLLGRESQSTEDAPAQPADRLRAAVLIVGTVLLVGAYTVALAWVPFFVATAVFLILCMLFYGRRPWWRVTLLGVGGAAALHWLFIEIIHLPLR
ncbi:MAG: tripartite tricarboxylate transporter TctB family protein [Azoarcus sp.]|nr:tripartite tricarboxylate transporter TctB family protein [Azoarcus sp.]